MEHGLSGLPPAQSRDKHVGRTIDVPDHFEFHRLRLALVERLEDAPVFSDAFRVGFAEIVSRSAVRGQVTFPAWSLDLRAPEA